ncbi:MAG: four helix bundle protein [Acidobacteria bacterium]|nr:four helix bundle protein [Acidobacteriota bacterium]
MEHSPDALRTRTKQFALRVIRLVRSLPGTAEARVIGGQVLRSATAIGANYRAAGRGRSRAEFAAKIGIVLEEADETVYWLELLVEGGVVAEKRMEALLHEGEQLVRIFSAMKATLRNRRS